MFLVVIMALLIKKRTFGLPASRQRKKVSLNSESRDLVGPAVRNPANPK